mgnify:CR=1 FL=1
MKINNNLGVFAPQTVRRRKGLVRRPPWYVEVPPDTVDIALLPRINRYERGGLRFHRFGSTQQKIADRLALFREAMGEIEPGLGYSEEEMRSGLEDVMRERMLMLEEAEQRSIQHHDQSKEISTSVEGESIKAVNLRDELFTDDDQQDQTQSVVAQSDTSEKGPLEGTPTDWLSRRLQQLNQP